MAKILIVDDEPTIVQLFRYIFEDAGHEVISAENGRLALTALQSGRVDFMVLDVAMPEMDGRGVAAELNRLSVHEPGLKKVPFVVMTGENYMDPGLNRIFASAPGFVCFFPKMTPPEKVLEKAEQVLGGGQGGGR